MFFTVRKNHDVELAIYLKNDVEMFYRLNATFTMQYHDLAELMTNISYIMTKVSKFYGVSLNPSPKKGRSVPIAGPCKWVFSFTNHILVCTKCKSHVNFLKQMI